MNEEMKAIDLAHAFGTAKLLGPVAGKQGRERLFASLAAHSDQTVVLDFAGMELITASAARESIVFVCKQLAEQGTPALLANVNQEIRDELAFAAEAIKVPLLLIEEAAGGKPVRGQLIGALDPKQRETLHVVASLGEADAKSACERAGDSTTGVTAWNNRLAGLASKGLLRERRAGKTKFYSLAMEGIVDGY